MFSYLDPSEYADFGVAGMTDDKIENACLVVDAYLSRPEGLTYTTDMEGYPLCMSRKLPEASFRFRADVSPGSDVAVSISSGPILVAGSALVLDRLTPSSAETVFVKQVIDTNNVILANVTKAHAALSPIEAGMVVENTLNVPKGRFFVTLPASPLRRLVSAVGRIGYSRRGDMQGTLSATAYGMLTSVSQFGGAPLWQLINVAASDIELEKNQVWTPMGLLMTPYSEVRMAYIAGYPESNVPVAVKRAVASLAKAIAESPASSSVSVFKAGEVQMERFVASVLDEDLRMMLSPYRANVYG